LFPGRTDCKSIANSDW